ncbi:MAG: RNase adapter RapZ [Thermoanaerobaculia bacterium]
MSHQPKLVLITGLSGSGKSTVAKCFEDLGYFCVDNLPLPLLRSFLRNPLDLVPGHDRIAVVTDVRAPGFARELPRLVAEIDRDTINPLLLFLEASEETLLRRFSETRRPHPLAGDRQAIDGIRQERQMLTELRGIADMVLDTSEWSIHETRDQIFREFASRPGEEPGLVVSLVSFGFKYGIPPGADLLFDVRFLSNPHFVPRLKELSGQDAEVRQYLERVPDYRQLIDHTEQLLLFLLPRYRKENRSYLTVGVGCTGGRHRSVAVAEELLKRLNRAGWSVHATHRDLER